MKKLILIIISLLISKTFFGQSSENLGIDNKDTLNRQEIDFLNASLKNSRDTFDFANKKIEFITGSSGSMLISKQTYFLTCVRPWTDKGLYPQITFVRLTNEEKQKSNGYDVIVMSWVKLFTNKQKNRIIKQLNKNK